MSDDRQSISVRLLSKRLKADLQRLAKADQRLLSRYIERILQEHVDTHGHTKRGAKK